MHTCYLPLINIMLLLIKLLIDCSLFILIWLVQAIIYPSFQYTSAKMLQFWHKRYQTLISYFVLPLMLCQLAIAVYSSIYLFNYWHLLQLILIVTVWASTFFQAVRVHKNIEKQIDVTKNVAKLVEVNKIRTALWTIVFGLSIMEAYKTFIQQ